MARKLVRQAPPVISIVGEVLIKQPFPPPIQLRGLELTLWDRIAPKARENGVIHDQNEGLLVVLCQTWARLQLAQQDWESAALMDNETHAAVLTASTGSMQVNPLYSQISTLTKLFVELQEKLGLTPASAQKLGIEMTKKESRNPADEFFN